MYNIPVCLYQKEIENRNQLEIDKYVEAVLEVYKWKPSYQVLEIEEIEDDDNDEWYKGCYEDVLNKSWSEIVYPDATPLIKFL